MEKISRAQRLLNAIESKRRVKINEYIIVERERIREDLLDTISEAVDAKAEKFEEVLTKIDKSEKELAKVRLTLSRYNKNQAETLLKVKALGDSFPEIVEKTYGVMERSSSTLEGIVSKEDSKEWRKIEELTKSATKILHEKEEEASKILIQLSKNPSNTTRQRLRVLSSEINRLKKTIESSERVTSKYYQTQIKDFKMFKNSLSSVTQALKDENDSLVKLREDFLKEASEISEKIAYEHKRLDDKMAQMVILEDVREFLE